MRPLRVTALAVLGALTLAAGAGCGDIYNYLEDGVVRPEAVAEIQISGGGGDVAFVPDETVKGVDIRRRVRYVDTAPATDATITVAGGIVSLKTDCGRLCGVSYEVRAPKGERGMRVTGENGSGDITLRGVSDVDIKVGSGDMEITNATGSVRAETGSGNITVTDAVGEVTITTGSGDVTGSNLRGPRTAIEVASGDITLDVPGTGNVSAVAGSGDIDVRVPDRTCQVIAQTDSGDRTVSVTSAPESTHTLDVRTGSGDITVRPGL